MRRRELGDYIQDILDAIVEIKDILRFRGGGWPECGINSSTNILASI